MKNVINAKDWLVLNTELRKWEAILRADVDDVKTNSIESDETELLQSLRRLWHPQLAVVVRVDNCMETSVSTCVDMLLAQTMDDLVIILMDSGLSTSVSRLCDSYAEYHKNVVVVHEEQGWNLGESMNAGLAIARVVDAEFVSFVTTNTRPIMRTYELCLKRIRELKADVAYCGMALYSPGALKSFERVQMLVEPFYGNLAVDREYGGASNDEVKTAICAVQNAPDGVFKLEDCPALLMNLLRSDPFVFRTEFLNGQNLIWYESDEMWSQIPFLTSALLATDRIVAVKENLIWVWCGDRHQTAELMLLKANPMQLVHACEEALYRLTAKRGHMDDLGQLGYALAAFVAVKNWAVYMPEVRRMKREHNAELVCLCEDDALPGEKRFAEYARALKKLLCRLDDGDTLMDHGNSFLNANDAAFIKPFLSVMF